MVKFGTFSGWFGMRETSWKIGTVPPNSGRLASMLYTAVQSQKAVSAYLLSKQSKPFGFSRQNSKGNSSIKWRITVHNFIWIGNMKTKFSWYTLQFIYLCNKGLWPKVQIQVQVLTVSVIHDVQMLLIYLSHLHFCYSSIDKIVLKMIEYNI